MNLRQYAELLRRDEAFMQNVECWRTVPAREARYAPFPDWLDPRLKDVLARRGIHKLYTHQASALEAAHEGRDMVVVTPTASGKTLC